MFAVLLIVSSYAWFSTTLNVKIKTFNLLVTKNDGLSISHDAVTYGNYIEISRELLYDDLGRTYPGYRTMWNANGLVPVSTNGPSSRNSHFFDVYTTSGILYSDFVNKKNGVVTTKLYDQSVPKKYSYFLAFDVFFHNDTGSPVADNLYFDGGTGFVINEELDEQMQGLVNSLRIGIVKVGSLPKTASPREVQNIKCNNDCEAIIFEPFSTQHAPMAIENALRNGIEVIPPTKEIEVFSLDLIDEPVYMNDMVEFTIKCKVSKGTYIRSLIRDIGVSLGTYATMTSLLRTKQGIFDIEKTSVNKEVNSYLQKLGKQGRIYYVSYDMPKSFVVTEKYVYITNVSVFTLKKRMNRKVKRLGYGL